MIHKIKKVERSYIYNFFIFLITAYSSHSTFLSSPIKFGSGYFDTGFFIFILLFIVYFLKKKDKIKIPYELIIFFMLWFLVNFYNIFLLSSKMQFFRIIKFFVTLFLLPSFTLLLIGHNFWIKMERLIYSLTLLSLPLYLLNNILPSFFDKMSNIFHYTTYDRLAVGSYWSSIIYVNAISENNFGNFLRNSGFMWEPGAFAMMIIIGIIINWLYNGISLNRRFIIYFLSLLTTFSTAGYLAIITLLSSKYLNKFTLRNFIKLSIIILFFNLFIFKLPFIGEEIYNYMDAYQTKSLNYDPQNMYFKGNRLVGAYYDWIEVSKNPFGYGLSKTSDFEKGFEVTGVSGLSNLMKMWGIPIFIYLMYLIWRFLKSNNRSNITLVSLIFVFLSLLIVLFSNPIQRNTLIYLIFISPILLKR